MPARPQDQPSAPPGERLRAVLEDDAGPVLRWPAGLRSGRFGVGGRAVRGVLLVAVVAVLVLGGRWWIAGQQADASVAAAPAGDRGSVSATGDRSAFATEDTDGGAADPSAAPTPSADGAGASPAAAGASAGAAASPSASGVTVHVVGQVKRPGVVVLPAGARVSDAVEEAGGASTQADLGSLNLARPLVDGEQVHVPRPGEEPAPVPAAPGAGAAAAPGAAGGAGVAGGSGGGASGVAGAPVNINTADLATLETLPGVGPVLAQRILDWRTEQGGFTTIEELNEVSGIGEKVYASLEPKVTV